MEHTIDEVLASRLFAGKVVMDDDECNWYVPVKSRECHDFIVYMHVYECMDTQYRSWLECDFMESPAWGIPYFCGEDAQWYHEFFRSLASYWLCEQVALEAVRKYIGME